MKDYDKRKSHISSKLHVTCISTNIFGVKWSGGLLEAVQVCAKLGCDRLRASCVFCSCVGLTILLGWLSDLLLYSENRFVQYLSNYKHRGADKSLARPGRKQANVS